jgi:acyl-CoA synthetase (AMP-forming)/AMP-acid ligase II
LTRSLLEAIQAERCTIVYGVPTMFIAELDHPRFKEFDLRSLRTDHGRRAVPSSHEARASDMHCPQMKSDMGSPKVRPSHAFAG